MKTLSEKQAAQIASPIVGDKLYQTRAREALPLLVRQAEAETSITYSDLADELRMPNARNLNYVLGSIGISLEKLGKAWKEPVPPIQCLVVNKTTGLPGDGIGWFLIKPKDFKSLPKREKSQLVQRNQQQIFAYSRWREVLGLLGLERATQDFSEVNRAAAAIGYGGGESPDHLCLKLYVHQRPSLVGLQSCKSFVEHALPSGDKLDVSFCTDEEWVAAEVKSARSTVADIARGLYQCVKYRAVMHAVGAAENTKRVVRSVLILEGPLPPSLIALRNILGVEVVENIDPARR